MNANDKVCECAGTGAPYLGAEAQRCGDQTLSTLGALEALIDPWLQHMTWRRDFVQWRTRRINQEYYQDERLSLLEHCIGTLQGITLLDLGAGMGGFAVAAALRGAHVVACEYNRAYCAIIEARAKRHNLVLPVVNAVGECIPLPTHCVDAIVSWDVIEHVQSPTHLLAESARVLRPGGYIVLTVINRRAWVDPHYHMRGINWLPRPLAEWLIVQRGRSKTGAAFQDMQRLSDMHYFGYGEFVRLAHRYGFSVRDLREEQLRAGLLHSPRRSRRMLRAVLRGLRIEHMAYMLQRRWSMAMFDLALCKTDCTLGA